MSYFKQLGLDFNRYLEECGAQNVPSVTTSLKQLEKRVRIRSFDEMATAITQCWETRLVSVDQKGPDTEKPTPKIIMINENDPEWEKIKKEHLQKWADSNKENEAPELPLKKNKGKEPAPIDPETKEERCKRIAKQHNKNKNNFPICESCNRTCYLSSHATKTVCQKDNLHLCTNCYDNLPLLDDQHNRRTCPNHDKCVTFESITDRRRFNNEDEEWTDYFRDTSRCRYHPNIKLFGEYESFCTICDKDDSAVTLFLDNRRKALYNIAGIVASKWLKQNKPEEEGWKSEAIKHAFHRNDTKLQSEVKDREREWDKEKRIATANLERILEVQGIPPTYTWIRQ